MQFDSVDIEPPVSYSLMPIIIIIMLFILCSLGLVLIYIRSRTRRAKPALVYTAPPKNLAEIKILYLAKCDDLLNQADQMAVRKLYQELSFAIRSFVNEVTGVDVTKYTLNDISKQDYPELYALIAEFYYPEFAVESRGDFRAAVGRTKETIERWN